MIAPTDERLVELSALLETWRESHLEAEKDMLKQFARVLGELKALERKVKARHERYRSELAALRYKLDTCANGPAEP